MNYTAGLCLEGLNGFRVDVEAAARQGEWLPIKLLTALFKE
jgi:hypothetical protein